MPRIQLSMNQDRIEVRASGIRRAAELILNDLGCTDSELSIVVVDDREMTELNWQYRGLDEPTDVLSFPMLEGEFADVTPEMLGDVVISAETAQRMAELHGCGLQTVFDVLLVHGILHLLAWDHLHPEDAADMDKKTLALLSKLGHPAGSLGWYATAAN